MTKFKSFLKSFTLYQKIFLAIVVLLTAAFVIFLPDEMVPEEYKASIALVVCAIISTIANPLCELLISKQSKWNFVIDFFLIEIPELVICLYFGWYAVAGTIMLFWMTIDVISYIRWNKHLDEEDENLVQVKRLKPWQSALMLVAIVVFGLVVGTLLRLIPSAADTYLDAFAAAVGMAIGAGQYIIGITATVLLVVFQWILHTTGLFNRSSNTVMNFKLSLCARPIETLTDLLETKGIHVKSMNFEKTSNNEFKVECVVKMPSKLSHIKLADELCGIEYIIGVEF